MYDALRVGAGVDVITAKGVTWLRTWVGTETDELSVTVNGVGQSEGAVYVINMENAWYVEVVLAVVVVA